MKKILTLVAISAIAVTFSSVTAFAGPSDSAAFALAAAKQYAAKNLQQSNAPASESEAPTIGFYHKDTCSSNCQQEIARRFVPNSNGKGGLVLTPER